MRKHDRAEERTVFQEASPYDPKTDSRADAAMVYGLNDTFEERVARWREAGYRIQVMTGVSASSCSLPSAASRPKYFSSTGCRGNPRRLVVG